MKDSKDVLAQSYSPDGEGIITPGLTGASGNLCCQIDAEKVKINDNTTLAQYIVDTENRTENRFVSFRVALDNEKEAREQAVSLLHREIETRTELLTQSLETLSQRATIIAKMAMNNSLELSRLSDYYLILDKQCNLTTIGIAVIAIVMFIASFFLDKQALGLLLLGCVGLLFGMINYTRCRSFEQLQKHHDEFKAKIDEVRQNQENFKTPGETS